MKNEKEEMTYKQPTSPYWERVKAEYPNQWVLIGNPVIPKGDCVIHAGELLVATDTRDELSAASRQYSGVYRAVRYTGKRAKRFMLFTL